MKRTTFEDPRPLPPGWEARQLPQPDGSHKTFFIDHTNKATTWTDPRPVPPNLQVFVPQGQNQGRQQQQPMASAMGGGGMMMMNAPANNMMMMNQQPRNGGMQMMKPNPNIAPMPSAPAAGSASGMSLAQQRQLYADFLSLALAAKRITPAEAEKLNQIRAKHGITDTIHMEVLNSLGVSPAQFQAMHVAEDAVASPAPQASPEPSAIEPGKECVVCMDAVANHIILDCMHICLCTDCAKLYANKKECPKCRSEIKRIAKTF